MKVTILAPSEFIGAIMELCQSRRGQLGGMDYLSETRVELRYTMPLAEIIFDFFDALKSRTRGYASLDYEEAGEQESDLVKVDILLQGEPVDAFSAIRHKDAAFSYGTMMATKLRELIPRQQFEVPIQAAIGSRIIARENIRAIRKDVLAKCYGGDITRKRKLLEKQKEGKKRMKTIGRVEVPQEAFVAALSTDSSAEKEEVGNRRVLLDPSVRACTGGGTMSVMTSVIPHGRPFTVDDLEGMPDDGNRYELIDGMLHVSPCPVPRHQEVLGELFVQLRAVCPADLRALVAPLAVQTAFGHRAAAGRAGRPATPTSGPKNLPVAPLLAVEVLSHSRRGSTTSTLKRCAYEKIGVRVVLDPRPDGARCAHRIRARRRRRATGRSRTSRATRSSSATRPFPVTVVPARLLDGLRPR